MANRLWPVEEGKVDVYDLLSEDAATKVPHRRWVNAEYICGIDLVYNTKGDTWTVGITFTNMSPIKFKFSTLSGAQDCVDVWQRRVESAGPQVYR